MQVIETKIPGVKIVEPRVLGDARGYFYESFHASRYAEHGISLPFVQDNLSRSRRGVLRGLHFQSPSFQGKLVSVLVGEVFDVAVDIRLGSPTFGQWTSVILSGDNKRQIYIPPGLAHGFLGLSDDVLFYYKCTSFYAHAEEMALAWNDPAIGIDWPIKDPILSEKDRLARPLAELPRERLMRFESDAGGN